MSKQDHEKNKRMKETVERLTKDPICKNCSQPYKKHKAFMENCPNDQEFLDGQEFYEDRFFEAA